jgi:hypothetical protein
MARTQHTLSYCFTNFLGTFFPPHHLENYVINYRTYNKVITKLLQRPNTGTATEKLQSTVIKKEQYEKLFKM